MNPILTQIKEQAAARFARQFFDEYKKIGVLNPDFRPLYSSGQLLKIAAEGDAAHEELKKRGEEERERGERELEAAFGEKMDSSYSSYSQNVDRMEKIDVQKSSNGLRHVMNTLKG